MSMSSLTHSCQCCGGTLIQKDALYVCRYCGTKYDPDEVEKHTQTMRELFDEYQLKQINSLRQNLYDSAFQKTNISRDEVRRNAYALKDLLPDDFMANFFLRAADDDIRELTAAIKEVDPVKYQNELPLIITFLVKSISEDGGFLLELNDLVERAYKNTDIALFNQYATMVSEQVDQLGKGVYEPSLHRDVFVAYSGKDMDKVKELVGELESQGIECFVAERNLRHGIGSVESYNDALKLAMDNCTVFLFVSTLNSRNMRCDAVRVEMDYIQRQDIAAAPDKRRRYEDIPREYKKPRVEYYLETSGSTPNIADRKTNEFFGGYERVYSVEGVVDRLFDILFSADVPPEPEKDPREEANDLYQLGKMYHDQQNYTAAVGYYRQAAELGHLFAQNWLGSFYENGQGVPKSPTEAVKWYRMAAEQGDAQASNTLGRFYEIGMGVPQDAIEAIKWYRVSAEAGHLFSQNSLALCYAYGKGVEKNPAEAAKWYQKAAEQGHTYAQYNLGCCYLEGNGVMRNLQEAAKWFRMAADQGHEDARDQLRKLGMR